MNRYTLQTVISLFVAAYLVGLNFYYDWASQVAMEHFALPFTLYNLFDLYVGRKHYFKNDKMTVVHHLIGFFAGLYLMWILPDYPEELYRLVWWLIIAETTTIFNNIRILSRKTSYSFHTSTLFAVMFVTLRSFMTVGSIGEVLYYEHGIVPKLVVWGLAALNATWCFMIVQMVRREYHNLKKGLQGKKDGKSIHEMIKEYTKRND